MKVLSVQDFIRACNELLVSAGEAEGQVTENFVYEALECFRRIHLCEKHPGAIKDTEVRYIVWMNWDLIEGLDEIHT